MSFPLPQRWTTGWQLVVTKCARNAMGGTDVEASLLGVALKPFTIDDYDVDAQGFDQLRGSIESTCIGLVQDALGAAQ